MSREYRLFKNALSRGSWARGVMMWAHDVMTGVMPRVQIDRESTIRMQAATGLISDEVAHARLHPEIYEQRMADEARAIQERKTDDERG